MHVYVQGSDTVLMTMPDFSTNVLLYGCRLSLVSLPSFRKVLNRVIPKSSRGKRQVTLLHPCEMQSPFANRPFDMQKSQRRMFLPGRGGQERDAKSRSNESGNRRGFIPFANHPGSEPGLLAERIDQIPKTVPFLQRDKDFIGHFRQCYAFMSR